MRLSRQGLALALVATLLFSVILSRGNVGASPNMSPLAATPGCPPAGCTGIFYGAYLPRMQDATVGFWQWPHDNYCGIANIQAIATYDYIKQLNQYPPHASQDSIHDRLNVGVAISQWGTGVRGSGKQWGPGPNVKADISADGGTDPRAIAWGAYDDTPPGYFFHNWIYRTNSTTATYYFGSDFGAQNGVNNPISVTIKRGAHSFVVDGVWANHDPSDPNIQKSIYYIDTWDPWLSYSGQGEDYEAHPPNGTHPYNTFRNQAWSLADWTSSGQLWGQGYNPSNGFDPEPNTPNGNYYNSPPLSAHWGGWYVTIEQDYITNNGPDIAYDQSGNPAPHN